MKIFKITIFLFTFFLALPVFADDVIVLSQFVQNSTWEKNSFVQTFKESSEIKFNKLAFQEHYYTTTTDVYFYICSGVFDINEPFFDGCGNDDLILYYANYPMGATDNWATTTLPSTITIDSDEDFYFKFYKNDTLDSNGTFPLLVSGESGDYTNGNFYLAQTSSPSSWINRINGDINFKIIYDSSEEITDFEIKSPTQDEYIINDTWITATGTCTTIGNNQIAFTNNCSDFSNLDFNIDCIDNEFSGDFYYNGLSDWVVAVDVDSVATDCVSYDDLMDVVEVQGLEIIEGYPDDWHFNYNYYDDYNIEIVEPVFDMPALTLPLGSTNKDFTFSFIYPMPLSPNLYFNIKQYDEDGGLLNSAYHNKQLTTMADTDEYVVNLTASTTAIHYVVQLLNDGDLVRQYPFGLFVSDLDLYINPDDYRFLFPRLVEKLKQKVVFNYYFTFYDGFYKMFNESIGTSSDDALDITVKSMSADHEYNLDIPIFTASSTTVKNFADSLRPFTVAILWMSFALYVVVRVNKFE